MRNAILVASGIAFGAVIAFIATRAADSRGELSDKKLVASYKVFSESFHAWEIDDVPSEREDAIWAVVRAKHSDLSAGENLAFDPWPLTSEDVSEEFMLGGVMQGAGPSARVIVQAMDLRKVAGSGSQDDTPLRLIVQLSSAGATVWPETKKTIISGTHFVGESIDPAPKWRDGELHLFTIFTESDGQTKKRSKYSVHLRVGDQSKVIGLEVAE